MKYDELLADLRGWPRVCASYEGSIDELLDKAADAIEKLLGVIQRQKETINATAYLPLYQKLKWIPVSERLPELRMWESGSLASSNVLFRTEDKTIHIGYVMEDFHVDDNGCLKIDRWFMLGGYRIENVTHWMPLPEPPESISNPDKLEEET